MKNWMPYCQVGQPNVIASGHRRYQIPSSGIGPTGLARIYQGNGKRNPHTSRMETLSGHANRGGTKRHNYFRLYLGDAQEKKNRHRQIQSENKCSWKAGMWHKLLGEICSTSAMDHNTAHYDADHDPRMAHMPTGLCFSILTSRG